MFAPGFAGDTKYKDAGNLQFLSSYLSNIYSQTHSYYESGAYTIMSKSKKQQRAEQEKKGKNALEKLNMKQRQFLLYWLGIEKPGNGYDCYCNVTRSYFYAFYENDPDASIKEEVKSVDDDGNVTTKEVFTQKYKNASKKGRQLREKEDIQEAKKYLRDEVDPVAFMRDLASQRSELGVAFRANKELMHIDGTTPSDGARAFTDFIKALANDDGSDE